MVVAKARPATYRDIEALPPGLVGEIVFGVLHTHPRPSGPHARAESALNGELYGPFDRGRGGPGGWILLVEPELHFAEEVIVPDLAAWRRERMAEVPRAAFITLVPDWICEVLSPSTEALDRSDKMDVYRREKVPSVWFVDPVLKTLEVFRLDGDTFRVERTVRGEGVVRLEPFHAIELPLSALWDSVAQE